MSKQTLLQKYGVIIEHLDFRFVETCSDGEYLEKLVEILRSGEEGYYPALLDATEKQLERVKPSSQLLVEDKGPYVPDRQDEKALTHQLKVWSLECKADESALKDGTPLDAFRDLPPMRSGQQSEHKDCNSKLEMQACDGGEPGRRRGALNEKLKGNESYGQGDFQEALRCYQRSLIHYPTPEVFSNMALIYLKQKEYEAAVSASSQALALDPTHLKALLRRADAFFHLGNLLQVYLQSQPFER
ncbi:unnamed protein product [Darwinula stevensoni]|uniref:Uncharacterized protein n=1 Tax=Darwinula stevensoni TaxID=69355 RepID=A0A7R8ZYN8_9CRUS|nr:unnamed protein product [Darwinula stevensoni]CAG0881871.1 unnamed protein product [Darwinula stevensoni]